MVFRCCSNSVRCGNSILWLLKKFYSLDGSQDILMKSCVFWLGFFCVLCGILWLLSSNLFLLWLSFSAMLMVVISNFTLLLFLDHTRCNVWILDGDLYNKGLLKFAVSAESLPETLVIFVADMSRPWTVMESLQKWASVLREHIDKMKIPPEEMRELERKCK